jgi:hypothetical protein
MTAFFTICAFISARISARGLPHRDLGAEVLAPVGPADAAARDAPSAQMNAFHARAVDEDLDQRPRRGKLVDGAAVDLEGDPLLVLPVVGAQRAAHGIEEAAQDAVFIERGHRIEFPRERRLDGLDVRLAGLGLRGAQSGLEARDE